MLWPQPTQSHSDLLCTWLPEASFQYKSDHVTPLLKTFQWFLTILGWRQIASIYIFLPCLTLQLLPLSLLQLHWLSSHPLPPLSAHHSLSASTRFGFSSPFSQLTPSHSPKINTRTISIRKPFLTYLSLNTNKNPYSLFIDHIFVVLIIVIISYLCVCFIFKCL